MVDAARRRAVAEDLEGLDRYEVVGGELVEKAAPSFEHGDAQRALARFSDPFHGGGGGDRPGGWWIGTEVEIELETHEIYVPDLTGWRRDRVPERPRGRPVRIRPDWVCEILSPSNASRDTVTKHRTLHRCGVPHYWIVDPERETLTVYRHAPEGYLVVHTAGRDDVVRAERFDALELYVGSLFGVET